MPISIGCMVIIFIGIVIGCLGTLTGKQAKTIYDYLNPTNYSSRMTNTQKNNFDFSQSKMSDYDLLKMRKKCLRLYSFFINGTSCLPLFGMLGTVLALLKMSGGENVAVSSSFYSALDTTAAGIVTAIICKCIDAFISPTIEDNEKRMDYLFDVKHN